MKTFAHRANDIQYLYMLYWKHRVRCFEIDVQISKDDVIIVYHDDISDIRHFEVEASIRRNVYTLAEFLRCVPDDITLNVEIKNYSGSAKANEVTKKIVDMCERHKGLKHIVYSSFDIRVVTALAKRGLKHWMLFDKYTKLMKKQPHICVDVRILDKVMKQMKNSTKVSVYGLHIDDKTRYMADPRYDFVMNWIVDI